MCVQSVWCLWCNLFLLLHAYVHTYHIILQSISSNNFTSMANTTVCSSYIWCYPQVNCNKNSVYSHTQGYVSPRHAYLQDSFSILSPRRRWDRSVTFPTCDGTLTRTRTIRNGQWLPQLRIKGKDHINVDFLPFRFSIFVPFHGSYLLFCVYSGYSSCVYASYIEYRTKHSLLYGPWYPISY